MSKEQQTEEFILPETKELIGILKSERKLVKTLSLFGFVSIGFFILFAMLAQVTDQILFGFLSAAAFIIIIVAFVSAKMTKDYIPDVLAALAKSKAADLSIQELRKKKEPVVKVTKTTTRRTKK